MQRCNLTNVGLRVQAELGKGGSRETSSLFFCLTGSHPVNHNATKMPFCPT